MTTKEQFIADKNTSSWWGVTSTDIRFDRVLLYAQAVAFEGVASAEQREGILAFKDILLTLALPDAAPVQFVKTGLSHKEFAPRIANLNAPPKPAQAPAPAPKPKTKK